MTTNFGSATMKENQQPTSANSKKGAFGKAFAINVAKGGLIIFHCKSPLNIYLCYEHFGKIKFQIPFCYKQNVSCDIMTTLTTRNEIVKTKRIISSELTKMQKVFYDEEILQYYKDDNEEHLYWEQFDCLKNEEIDYSTFNKIIGLNHTDIDTFVNKLTAKLTELFQIVNALDFIIISHLKLDFFGNRDNKFKPLKNAYKKLEKIVGNTTFKEAFEIDINNLSDFVEILFWTTRCDPSVAEYIFLFDKDEQIQFHLCKYGNLHLTEYNKEQLTQDKLKELGWAIIEGQEFDNFTESRKIEGRKIKL